MTVEIRANVRVTSVGFLLADALAPALALALAPSVQAPLNGTQEIPNIFIT